MNARLFALLSVVIPGLAFAGDVYYVDPRGDNTWDGSVPWESRDEGANKGPRKTLAKVMELTTANSEDVVYAAEGVYDADNKNNYRVWMTAGVKLIASGRKGETVIEGAPDPDYAEDLSVSPYGCGPKAMRGVYLPANAQLVGFTVRDCYGQGTDKWGAGIVGADATALVVDCVISNCISGRAGGMNSGTAIRCDFNMNKALVSGRQMQKAVAYNCRFSGAGSAGSVFAVYQSTLYNCDVRGGDDIAECTLYNSYNAGMSRRNDKLYFSRYGDTLSSSSTCVTNSQFASAALMPIDDNMRPVPPAELSIDKGSYYYYTNGASAAVLAYLDKDFAGGQRVYNGEIDIGCGEYDPRSAWASALCPLAGFSVETVSPDVRLSENALVLTKGSALTTGWTAPVSYEVSYRCSLTGVVSGSATLSVYLDDAALPFATVTAADGAKVISYRNDGSHQLRFVVTGEGSATVSGFDFKWGKRYYVDPRGDNTWDGSVPYENRDEGAKKGPRKTLAKVMELTTANNEDVVYAAEGIYDSGSYNSCRVWLTGGTKLIASGRREETVIEGAPDPDHAADLTVSPYGCGPKATRGVYLPSDAQVVGFTLRNCFGLGTDKWGGAIIGVDDRAGLAVDCVVSNCVSGRGAGITAATAIRCEFAHNTGVTSGSHAQNATCYGCFFHDAHHSSDYIYDVYNSILHNCRVICQANGCSVYNSYVYSDRANDTFYYSAYSAKAASSTNVEGSFVLSLAEAAVDDRGRPTAANSALTDAGSYYYYTNGASAAVLAYLDKDFAGGQRVYNGKIDIGLGEYDWRGDFAKKLKPRVLTVETASAGVEMGTDGVTVKDGGSLSFSFLLTKFDGDCTFRVDGNATVTATDGTGARVLEPVGGVYTLEDVPLHVKSAVITVTGGPATVKDIKVPAGGLCLIVR